MGGKGHRGPPRHHWGGSQHNPECLGENGLVGSGARLGRGPCCRGPALGGCKGSDLTAGDSQTTMPLTRSTLRPRSAPFFLPRGPAFFYRLWNRRPLPNAAACFFVRCFWRAKIVSSATGPLLAVPAGVGGATVPWKAGSPPEPELAGSSGLIPGLCPRVASSGAISSLLLYPATFPGWSCMSLGMRCSPAPTTKSKGDPAY